MDEVSNEPPGAAKSFGACSGVYERMERQLADRSVKAARVPLT